MARPSSARYPWSARAALTSPTEVGAAGMVDASLRSPRYGHRMDLGVRGRRAAVAAASAGLGYASAAALAADGVAVAICGRDRARVEDAAASIGNGTVGLVADVCTAAGADGFVAAAREALGGVDILVTNAG